MDGVEGYEGILVIAATNRIEDLDPALLRPGRFDKKLYISEPKYKKDRDDIIDLYLSKKNCDETVSVDKISKLFYGMSGADIENSLNEATLISVRDDRKGVITVKDVEEATMKIRVNGVKLLQYNEDDVKLSAVHEAGHAIVSGVFGRKCAKIAVVPYSSGVGGVTVEDIDDIDDKRFVSMNRTLENIVILLSGRVAESYILGDYSNGCGNDIERASNLAYMLVDQYGYYESDMLSLRALNNTGVLCDTKDKIEKANKLMRSSYEQANNIIRKNKQKIEKLAKDLERDEVIYDFDYNSYFEGVALLN
jgi:cell division protease FtsH